jgi:hypothetical protein
MSSDSDSMQEFIQPLVLFGNIFVIKYFVYIFCHFSSWFKLPGPFFIFMQCLVPCA